MLPSRNKRDFAKRSLRDKGLLKKRLLKLSVSDLKNRRQKDFVKRSLKDKL